jgi:hypothetical protein
MVNIVRRQGCRPAASVRLTKLVAARDPNTVSRKSHGAKPRHLQHHAGHLGGIQTAADN